MWEKITEAISHWFEATSPARKVADVAVAFVIAILGGSVYLAYNAESDIRRLAVKALDKQPELNADLAKKLAIPLFADCQKSGAIALAVFKVDLAGNTTRLVTFLGPDQIKEKFPRLKSGLDKVPFIFEGMPSGQLQVASSMMTGTWDVAYNEAADVTLVAVPIPEQTHAYLAGFVMVALQGKVPSDSPIISNIRLLLSDYAGLTL